MPPFLQFQINLILFLQGLGHWLQFPMLAITSLGEEYFFLLVMPALYWCVDPGLGVRTGLVLLISAGLNGVLKLAFHAPRPFWVDSRVQAMAVQTDFGIPSGHAQNAMAVWGILAYSIQKRWAWIVAILLILLISLSRLYLGVHFLSDVLAGWIVGGIILWLMLRLENPIKHWFSRHALWINLIISLAASLALVFLGEFIRINTSANPIPSLWVQNASLAYPSLGTIRQAIVPFDISGIVTAGGVLFGLAAGILLLPKFGGFKIKEVWWKLLLRFLVGVVGVLILWQGLDRVFPSGSDLVADFFRYLRYALVGVWVTGFAPPVFCWMGLARR